MAGQIAVDVVEEALLRVQGSGLDLLRGAEDGQALGDPHLRLLESRVEPLQGLGTDTGDTQVLEAAVVHVQGQLGGGLRRSVTFGGRRVGGGQRRKGDYQTGGGALHPFGGGCG